MVPSGSDLLGGGKATTVIVSFALSRLFRICPGLPSYKVLWGFCCPPRPHCIDASRSKQGQANRAGLGFIGFRGLGFRV